MMNAQLPLSSMSWPRLLLIVFVSAFVLSSIVSVLLLDEGEEWRNDEYDYHRYRYHTERYNEREERAAHTQHTQTVNIAHSLLNAQSSHEQHTTGHKKGKGGEAHSQQEQQQSPASSVLPPKNVLSLSNLLFPSLDAELQRIAKMEETVNKAFKHQQQATATQEKQDTEKAQQTAMKPLSPFATHPLLLSNLTLRPHTFLTTINRLFSLFIVEVDPKQQHSLISHYVRSSTPFFLDRPGFTTPHRQRQVVTDDWEMLCRNTITGPVTHSSISSDHRWLIAAHYNVTQETEGLDYNLLLTVFRFHPADFDLLSSSSPSIHSHTNCSDSIIMPLSNHQPVTALTIYATSATTATVLYARHADNRLFRSINVSLNTYNTSDNDELCEQPAMSYTELPAGPWIYSHHFQADVIHVLPFNQSVNKMSSTSTATDHDSDDSSAPLLDLLVIEYDEHRDGAAFVSSLFTQSGSSANDSDHPPAPHNHTDTNQTRPHADDVVPPTDTHNQLELDPIMEQASAGAAAASSDHLSLISSPWSRITILPQYRRSLFRHPSAFLVDHSADYTYLAFSTVPFLTTVDTTHKFDPIELIHLHPDTLFTAITMQQHGQLLVIADQQQDCIILHRALSKLYDNHTHTYRIVAGHWEVLMELIFPPYLRRLRISTMKLVDIHRNNTPDIHTQRRALIQQTTTTAETGETHEQQETATVPDTAVEIESDGGLGAITVTPAVGWTDTYLVVLFETGVLASFDLDIRTLDADTSSVQFVSSPPFASSVLHSVLPNVVLSMFGELLYNWEFVIGVAVVVFSAVFSIQMSSINRALQQTAGAR